MRVKFLRDEQYENEGRNLGPKFAEGEVYDFTEAFGQRWVQRGAVEVLDAAVLVEENTFKPVTKVANKEPATSEADKSVAAQNAADDKAAPDQAEVVKAAADKAASDKAPASRKL